jgi:N-acetylmuramoyl-L-alanine amidase
MPSLYFSPSCQENNVGVGSYGTEEKEMNLIADRAIPLLQYNGITIFRNSPTMTINQVVADSNAKHPDAHFALHSNALNSLARGAEIFHFSTSTKGKALAQAVYNEIAPLTPTTDRGLKVNDSLAEMHSIVAPSALLEVGFHDNYADAGWIMEHKQEIAVAIAKGICKYFGITYKAPGTPAPTVTLYKVQVGAYSVKANAEDLVNRLKADGYDAFIV